MSLSLPTNFRNDIQDRDTSLTPVVLIGNKEYGHIPNPIYLSTGYHPTAGFASGSNYYPILLNIPSLKESIDIEKRKYKISSVNLDISNFPHNGKRFSEVISTSSLINTECRIYWFTPSTTTMGLDDDYNNLPSDSWNWGLQIFNGTIRKYTHDDEKVRLVVEDRSQATLHKDLPLEKNYLGTGDDVPDKYKNKPIPMVYGNVDRSPCVIKNAPIINEWGLDSGAINVYMDNDTSTSTMYDSPERFYLFTEDRYVQIYSSLQYAIDQIYYNTPANIFGYPPSTEQYTTSGNIILMESNYVEGLDKVNPISDNILICSGQGRVKAIPIQKKSEKHSSGGADVIATETYFTSLGNNIDTVNDAENIGAIANIEVFGSLIYDRSDQAPSWGGGSFLNEMPEETDADVAYVGAFGGNAGNIETSEASLVGITILHDVVNSELSESYVQYWLEIEFGNGQRWEGETTKGINVRISDIANHPSTFTWTDYPPHVGVWAEHISHAFAQPISNPSSFDIYIQPQSDSNYGGIAAKIKIINLQLAHSIAVENIYSQDFYANVTGRAFVEHVVGFETYYTPPTLQSVIVDILNTGLGQDITLPEGTYNWQYAFTVDKKINSKKLIEGIASASPYIPRFNNMGEFRVDVIPEDGVTADHTIKEADVIDFSFSRSKIEDVYTKVIFKYNWDYARGDFNSSYEVEIDTILGVDYKFDYYGIKLPEQQIDGTSIHPESTLTIDDDRGKYIRDETTAKKFADWFLLWSCNQHLKMKVKLPLKYMNLEIGDMVDFDAILGGVEPYGIDYTGSSTPNGQNFYENFLITSTNKTLEWVEIECIQMHNLTDEQDEPPVEEEVEPPVEEEVEEDVETEDGTIFEADIPYPVTASMELDGYRIRFIGNLLPDLISVYGIDGGSAEWNGESWDFSEGWDFSTNFVGGVTYTIMFSETTTTDLFTLND